MGVDKDIVSTVFGIIIGPYAIGIFNPMGWSEFDNVTLEFTRIVIAVQVMAAAALGGIRAKRFALVLENGKITKAFVEPNNTGLSVSLAENLLKEL
ncbi:hypothetical protein BGZ83_000355 [Gryganskiella cystojenkinii]|nr:hypothetical protein BGZ83_000355 [Gryganskiella cystojenkinii]